MVGILHICDYAANYKGNFIMSLLQLESFLKDKNIKQVYLFPNRAYETNAINWINELKAQGHIVYIQSENLYKNFKLLKKIKKEHSIKTVFRHFNNTKDDILTKLVFGGKNTIHFFHSMYKPSNIIKNTIKKFLFMGNTLVGVSKAVSDILEKSFKNKVVTIENAVNFERLNHFDYTENESEITCLVMGYDIVSKGTDLAIDGIKILKDKYNIHLNIVAASHLDELNNLLKEKDVENSQWISILPPTEKIATYYKNSDIFLAPSRFEGFSYALVEATYCEMTPVFSNIEAHKLLKIDNRFMFMAENTEDFVQKIENAITNQNMNLKQIFKENVIKEYGVKNWCKKIYKLI